MEQNENKTQVIDLKKIVKRVMEHKLSFALTLIISFTISCLYIITIPRYYSTDTQLAPEIESSMETSTLGSLASSFGFDMSKMNSQDAITPLLYPELMKDNKFVYSFFPIKVKSQDGKIETNYFEYLSKYQKMSTLYTLFSKKKDTMNMDFPNAKTNPYALNEEQTKIIDQIREDVKVSVDSKTGVITIKTTSQDPLICKTLADSIRGILQRYITAYRTNKARADVAYYKKLALDAKSSFEKSRQLYGSYADANTEVVLESFRSKQEDLENDMQLKYNTYSQLNQQLQSAMTKLREKTPAFTILKGAEVPIKPAGPKRMILVLAITILSLFVYTLIILRKDISKLFV